MSIRYKSLSSTVKTNKFSFICPIFDVQTAMPQCITLRDKLWRGEEIPVRKGCQACMSSGKCPAAEIVRRISYGKDTPDDYGSDIPIVGKLRRDVLEKIETVIVQDRHMNQFGVSEAERELILSANTRIQAQLAKAPEPSNRQNSVTASPSSEKRMAFSRKSVSKPVAAIPAPKTISDAARTGDMSAALNMEA